VRCARIAVRLMAAAVALALAAGLAGCGKKGDLDPPPGKQSTFPRTYPKPQ